MTWTMNFILKLNSKSAEMQFIHLISYLLDKLLIKNGHIILKIAGIDLMINLIRKIKLQNVDYNKSV